MMSRWFDRMFDNSLGSPAGKRGRRSAAHSGATRGRTRAALESLEARQMLAGAPVITEFMASNVTTLADEDNEFRDWIEIYNPDATAINLEDWSLTDRENALDRWKFPDVLLNPGAYMVVWASGKDRLGTGPQGQLHTNFSLGAGGEFLALVRPDGTIEQQFISDNGEYPTQYADISYGLNPADDQETYFLSPTPGAMNAGATTADPTADVVITEIMYHPLGHAPGEEFIELHNRSAAPVGLDGWQIADGVQYAFTAGTSIAAGGYLVVAANVAAFQAVHPGASNVVGGWTGELSNTGEQIDVRDAQDRRIDQVRFADEGDWATRRRGPLDHNHRGWVWDSTADGGGMSLERVSLALTNNTGQNWLPSNVRGGTPGVVNLTIDSNIAPLVRDVRQT
ncbi:MAG: lamin tail domain-containing protein, partial [Pirellulales bacterium]